MKLVLASGIQLETLLVVVVVIYLCERLQFVEVVQKGAQH